MKIRKITNCLYPFRPSALQGGPDKESTEAEDVKKKEALERDDPETLRKAREWDDWKDSTSPYLWSRPSSLDFILLGQLICLKLKLFLPI